MDSHKDQPEQPLAEDRSPDLSRRQIIRGMAAVPVVMTLSNGAGAASESQLQCITGTQPLGEQDCIKGNNQMLRELDTVYGPAYTDIFDTGDGTAVRTINQDGKACVMYVTENGNPTGHSGGIPVTASCYTSFALT